MPAEIAKALCYSRLFAYLHHLRSELPSLKLVRSRHDFSNQRRQCTHPFQHTLTISTAWPIILTVVSGGIQFCSRLVQFCTSIQPHTMSIESNLLRLAQHEHPFRPTFLVCQLSLYVNFPCLSTFLVCQVTRHKFVSFNLCPCFVDHVQHFRNQLTSLSDSL